MTINSIGGNADSYWMWPSVIPVTSGGAGIPTTSITIGSASSSNNGSTPISSIYTYQAVITAYDPITKIATLGSPNGPSDTSWNGINVSSGINSNYGKIDSTYTINGNTTTPNVVTTTTTSFAQAIYQGTNIPQLSTDENGNFVGIFNLPPNSFNLGQRILRLDNRTVTQDPTTATTYAESVFTASALNSNINNQDFASAVDSATTSFTQSSQISSKVVNDNPPVSPYDPLAQTFLISKDNYPNGVFISSVKLFFAAVPAGNHPVTLQIVNTLNGYPNGKVLDYSTVVLNPSQITVSTPTTSGGGPNYLDPTTATKFTFQAPVYIQPGVLYAIMVTSSSPDYQVYYAQQNQIAIPSTAKATPTSAPPTNPTKIGTAPYTGALFESQNAITWTADLSKSLMFIIDRFVFNTSAGGTLQFSVPKNLPYRKLGTQDIIYSIDPNSISNLFGNFAMFDQYFDAINVTTTDFVPTGTSIGYQYASTLKQGNTSSGIAQVTPGKYGAPTPENITLDDGRGQRVLLASSNNSFYVNAQLTSSDADVSPIISDDGLSVYTISNVINNLGISNNNITLVSGGYGYNANTIGVAVSNPDVGTNICQLGWNVTNGTLTSIYVINPGSGYLTTPTITITDANTRSGNANASVSVTGETSPVGGNALCKYITKKVILTPGNDSGDLRVFHTAYRPTGTDVFVYYKIISSEDSSVFETGNWQLMTTVSNQNAYSTDKTDLIEFECAPGVNNIADNSISYTNASGQTYNSFIQFAIKIVLSSDDSTTVPFLTDIRALALPSGSGL